MYITMGASMATVMTDACYTFSNHRETALCMPLWELLSRCWRLTPVTRSHMTGKRLYISCMGASVAMVMTGAWYITPLFWLYKSCSAKGYHNDYECWVVRPKAYLKVFYQRLCEYRGTRWLPTPKRYIQITMRRRYQNINADLQILTRTQQGRMQWNGDEEWADRLRRYCDVYECNI
jgi:hypothetical protein